MTQRPELWQLLDGIQQDIRAATSKLVQIRSLVASLNVVDKQRPACPDCGLSFAGRLPLAEHRYHAHNGPEPAHWQTLEARIAPDADEAA